MNTTKKADILTVISKSTKQRLVNEEHTGILSAEIGISVISGVIVYKKDRF